MQKKGVEIESGGVKKRKRRRKLRVGKFQVGGKDFKFFHILFQIFHVCNTEFLCSACTLKNHNPYKSIIFLSPTQTTPV